MIDLKKTVHVYLDILYIRHVEKVNDETVLLSVHDQFSECLYQGIIFSGAVSIFLNTAMEGTLFRIPIDYHFKLLRFQYQIKKQPGLVSVFKLTHQIDF